MTTTQDSPGNALAAGMQVKPGYAELLGEEVDKFNADAVEHGKAWDKTFADTEALIDGAETLKFSDFQKKMNAVSSSRLKLLQERLQLFARRQSLLLEIHTELNDRVDACQSTIDSVRSMAEAGLRAAGKGPEDSKLWKRGSTNLATVDFNKEVDAAPALVEAQRAWRATRQLYSEVHHVNVWSSEAEVKEELREFVATMTGVTQC